MEIWKNIEGYGSYAVSNLGKVKSLKGSEKILKPSFSKWGYLYVDLCKNGRVKHFNIHRLVALSFIPNPENLPQVNHINEDKTDNRVENLEWVSAKDNSNWGTRNERVALKNSVPVCQFDMNGNFLKEWVSLSQATRELGICQSNIVKCCKGRYKSAGGFKWKYAKKAEK